MMRRPRCRSRASAAIRGRSPPRLRYRRMVRERVGDWRLAWRFALAGLIAGMLVTAFGYVGVINRSFDAAQDQLFPAPSPDPRITLVAIDQKSNDRLGTYPWLNSYHAKVINYLASLHPKVILFDIVLDHDTGFDPETPTDNTDADLTSAIKSAGNVVLVCTADDQPRPELALVALERIHAGDVYPQAVSFPHDRSFCPPSKPKCMLDNQNYGYRIMGDAMSPVLSDRYIHEQPPISMYLAILLLSTIVGLVVYVLSFRSGMLLTAVILLAYFAITIALGQKGYLSDPLFAPIAIALAASFSLRARYVLEERERRKVELIFGHSIDPRIARQLTPPQSIDEIISHGERRDLTMLFVDIRGFTALS